MVDDVMVLNNHFLGQNLRELIGYFGQAGDEKVGCSRIIQKANCNSGPRGVNSEEAEGR
jgi:hypothetical protein